jgi:hypothetical protein
MTNRALLGFLLVVLATGLAGCDGASSPSPTAPTTAQPQPPPPPPPPPPPTGGFDSYNVANVTLSGVVYEMTSMGRVPIEGVLVRSDYFHMFPTPDVVTDSRGFFSFRPVWVCPCSLALWVDAGITAIWVDKDGYEVQAGQPASVFGRRLDPDVRPDLRLRDVTINGDTRFDVELVRRW